MPTTSPKTTRDMPMWARILAAVIGVGLLALGLCGFFFVRPLEWKLVAAVIASVGLAVDLLYGAYYAEWPISALMWLVP
jgi:hypothetical protein